MGRSALYYEDYVLSIQRFSLVINAKPHLAEPYFYRGLAKFYLEDFSGAETDVTSAITRNPYTSNYYVLRGLCRVNSGKYAEAEQDYQKSIRINAEDADSWHNMVLCQVEQKEYDRADSCLNIMIKKWPKVSNNYTIKAQVLLCKEDTVESENWIDRALEINAFEGSAHSLKAMFHLKRDDYAKAEESLTQAIIQLPRHADLFINRAMARYYQDNLRGAMSDYDAALEINNRSLIGHFNRALLRSQVGDDNRAIEDFNYVIEHEPDNYVAIYNRAILLKNTGNYKACIQDLTTILNEYPNFWDGYTLRASARRKIGDTYGAERDEFKVVKARMEGTLAGKKRSNSKTRKESDQSLEDYNKLVESDDNQYHEEYASEYRGKVQDRDTEMKLEKQFVLSYYSTQSFGQSVHYLPYIESFNKEHPLLPSPLKITNNEGHYDTSDTEKYLSDIAVQSEIIDKNSTLQNSELLSALLLRALDYYYARDFESSILDLDVVLNMDKDNLVALFLRGQVRYALNATIEEMTKDVRLELNKAIDDFKSVYDHDNDFIYAMYNTGNIYYHLHEYDKAVEVYTTLISIDSHFSEAFYNRGLSYIMLGQIEKGLADLSQAGEYGLYSAYNLIKKYSKK